MSYLVYLPGRKAASPADLTAAGFDVGDVANLPGGPETREVVSNGPDKGSGCVGVWRVAGIDPPQVGHFPERQEWRQAPGKAFWLGRDKGTPITPAALARPNQYTGEMVRCADGNDWEMPIAKQLPCRHGLDADGKFHRVIKPAFAEYWEQTGKFAHQYDTHDATTGSVMYYANGWPFVVMGLRFNYVVNSEVLDFLGLVDDEVYLPLIGASFELRMQAELQKKTAATTPDG